VESLVVVPVHPPQRGELDLLDGLPRAGAGGAADQLGLVVAVDALGQRVIEAVADRPDRRDRADLGEPFAVADRGELGESLGFGQAAPDAGIARSMGSKGDCWDNAVAESFFTATKRVSPPPTESRRSPRPSWSPP
jgi:hypothetical protein